MFGRKSRAERLKERAEETSFIPTATLVAAYAGAKPVVERLLYDDDLRDNIRTFIESVREIVDEVSDEDPTEIVAKLWDDDKLRKQIEAAAGAAQEGNKRIRGQRVRGDRSSRLPLLIIAAGVGFVFLNPRTGPEARRITRQAINSLTGS